MGLILFAEMKGIDLTCDLKIKTSERIQEEIFGFLSL
jgi:hypothetical protein